MMKGAKGDIGKLVDELRERFTREEPTELLLGKALTPDGVQKIRIVPTIDRGTRRLSCFLFGVTAHTTKHISIADCLSIVETYFGSELGSLTMRSARFELRADLSRRGRLQIARRKLAADSAEDVQSLQNEKLRGLNLKEPFWQALGLINASGRPMRGMYGKLQQVEKFCAHLESILHEVASDPTKPLTIVDFGSGKHYLTFAIASLLQSRGYSAARVIGVEMRSALVQVGMEHAHLVHGLTFEQGTISSWKLPPAAANEKLIIVALHACDTATDDAIAQASAHHAEAILLAPCCQKFVRRHFVVPEALRPLYRFPIQEERLAIELTDTLRSWYLESLGYHTAVFEFVGLEHSGRNTMITGVQRGDRGVSRADTTEIGTVKLKQLLEQFGLSRFSTELPPL